MRIEEAYEGNYLEGRLLPEGALVPVEIERIVEPGVTKDAKGKVIDKAILHFKGKDAGLILCKVNYDAICFVLGTRPSEWIGKTIQLQRRYLAANRNPKRIQNLPCVRVIPPEGTPVSAKVIEHMGTKHPVGVKE